MPLIIKNPHDKDPKAKGIKEPMVIFPLRQYETLMEHLEDVEDRLAVMERANEPNISQQEVEEMWGVDTVEQISEKAMDYRARKQGKEPEMKHFKYKTMHLEARKIKFVQEFLRLQNEEIVSGLEKLLRKKKSDLFEKELTPMSIEQFNNEIDNAMADSEMGKITSARELKKKVNKWG